MAVARTLPLLFACILSAGCAAAVATGAARGPAGDGRSAEVRRADGHISAQVNYRLVQAPEVDAVDVRVRTAYGVVTLEGTVRSLQARRIAERAARSVDGVREVVGPAACRAGGMRGRSSVRNLR